MAMPEGPIIQSDTHLSETRRWRNTCVSGQNQKANRQIFRCERVLHNPALRMLRQYMKKNHYLDTKCLGDENTLEDESPIPENINKLRNRTSGGYLDTPLGRRVASDPKSRSEQTRQAIPASHPP